MKIRNPNVSVAVFWHEGYSFDFVKNIADQTIKAISSKKIGIVSKVYVTNQKEVEDSIKELESKDFDCLIALVCGWVETPVVIDTLQSFYHKPLLLWSTNGEFKNREFITPAPLAGVGPVRQTLEAMGVNFKYIYNTIDKGIEITSALDFIAAAKCSNELKHKIVGIQGFADQRTLTHTFDAVSLKLKIGPNIEDFTIFEVTEKMKKFQNSEIDKVINEKISKWKFESARSEDSVDAAARMYLAIREIILERDFSSITMKCFGFANLVGYTPCMIYTILADEIADCICGTDVLASVSQLILRELTGQSTTYLETIDLFSDRMIMHSCGYTPLSFINGQCRTEEVNWGGERIPGYKNCSAIKPGIYTIVRLSSIGDKYKIHAAIGDGAKPLPYKEEGWESNIELPCVPSLEMKIISNTMDHFLQHLSSQHYLITPGDHLKKVIDLCKILKIECIF
jgi:L-fucose isomerase-like protein